MKWKALALCVLLALTGCSTGFNRGAMSERLQDEDLKVTDADIQEVLKRKGQLDFPLKVAVQLVGETNRRSRETDRPPMRLPKAEPWRWSVEDKEKIEKWGASLEEQGVVSDVFVISDLVSSGDDLKSARLAAAKYGADVVLYVKGTTQVDDYYNPLVVSNLLILPGWFVPSAHSDALFMMKGAMFDVRNEFLYASVEAEGVGEVMGPPALIENKDSIEKAKTQALKNFGDEFIERMRALKNAE